MGSAAASGANAATADGAAGGSRNEKLASTENKPDDTTRQKAIKEAWDKEKERVLKGIGTRDWTVGQQAELIKYRRVTGFEGQHMKNASSYPVFPGNTDNIQFVTYEEHLYGAHG